MHKHHASDFYTLYKFKMCSIPILKMKRNAAYRIPFQIFDKYTKGESRLISSGSPPAQSSPSAPPLRMEMHRASLHGLQPKSAYRLHHTASHSTKSSTASVPVPTILPYPLQRIDSAVSHTASHPASHPQSQSHQNCGHSCCRYTAVQPSGLPKKNPVQYPRWLTL